jgi:uncharacterized protein (TIGR03437 family)
MRIRAALILTSTLLLATFLNAADIALPYSLEVFAGSNVVGDGTLAVRSPLGDAEGVAIDRAGNIYLADATDNRVRMIAPSGIISTVFGTGTPGPLTLPYGVAVDPSGNLFVADLGNNRILKISPGGTATTLLDHLASPRNVLLDPLGNLYFSEFSGHRVRRLAPDGSVTLIAGTGIAGSDGDGNLAVAAKLNSPAGLAFDSAGALYIADSGNHKVRKVVAGRISTLLGTGAAGDSAVNQLYSPTSVVVDSLGNLYIADSGNKRIRKLSLLGVVSTVPGAARDLAVASDGSLLGAGGAQAIRILPTGIVTIIAGDGSYFFRGDFGPANQARLNQPAGVALDPAGNVWISDTANSRIRSVDAQGVIRSAATGPLVAPAGIAFAPSGDLLIADISAHQIREFPANLSSAFTIAGTGTPGQGSDGFPAIYSPLSLPASVAAGPGGVFYFADSGNHRIRRVFASGLVSTIAGNGAAGNGGDGAGQGTQLRSPAGIALDNDGNVWIADTGNNRVRKLSPDGYIATIVGADRLNQPRGLAVDKFGNLWIADTGNHRLLVQPPGGTLTVVTDQLQQPVGVAVNPVTGSVFVADQGSNRVYRLNPPPPALTEAPPTLVVVHAATLLNGPVAPGSLITVFGPDLTGVQAYFDGIAAPRLAITDSQFNVQVPPNATGAFELRSATVLLTTTLTIAPSAPGIFTGPGGTGAALAANQDGSLNSADRPAAAGDIVTFYATGVGLNTSVTATVGGTGATVLYAGDSPGLTGITQINLRIPAGLSSGPQPLNIQAGSGVSQAGVSIAVQAR